MNIREILAKIVYPKARMFLKYISSEEVIDLTRNGDMSISFWNNIKQYINPNVRRLKLNLTNGIKDDLEYLKRFDKLEIIEFDKNEIISERELNIISETNVMSIICGDVILDYEKVNGNSVSVVSYGGNTRLFYNGIDVQVLAPNRVSGDKISIEVERIDKYNIMKLLDGVDINKYQELSLLTMNNFSTYEMKYNGKVVNELKMTCSSVEEIERFYNYIEESGYILNKTVIILNALNVSEAKDIISLLRQIFYVINGNKNEIMLSLLTKDGWFNFSFKDGIIKDSEISVDNLDDILEYYNVFRISGYNVVNFNVRLDFVDKYREDFDYEKLRRISKSVKLNFIYSENHKASFEEFYSMVESVRWYKSLINEGDLSPVEKLMYAYDIVKGFPFSDGIGVGELGRAPHKIIEDGNIVCSGYVRLIEEILDGVPGIGACEFQVKSENHSRMLVRVDDEKYNIHGIYALDPTWDSELDVQEKREYIKVVNEYNALDFYRYFLIPMKDYFDVFNTKEVPPIYNIVNTIEDRRTIDDNNYLSYKLRRLFCNEESEEKLKIYTRATRPSLEEFKSMFVNVRIAQGYSEEEAIKEMERVVLENEFVIKFDNKRLGGANAFFEEENKRKF